jgi:predicted site-specific integrase-resolvase
MGMEGERLYAPREFARLIGRSVATLQRWDRQGILHAYRSPTNRRYYTQTQYLQYRSQKQPEGGQAHAARQENPAQPE